MINDAHVYVIPEIRTIYEKLGLIYAKQDFSPTCVIVAEAFRNKKIPVNIGWGKSIKGQLNYLKKTGWNKNLIFVGEEEGFFFYQDTHEYHQWMCEEYGIVNFAKIKYPITEEGITSCIDEQGLIQQVL